MSVFVFILMESLTTNTVFLQPIDNADFIVPVEIEGTTHQVRVGLCFFVLHVHHPGLSR